MLDCFFNKQAEICDCCVRNNYKQCDVAVDGNLYSPCSPSPSKPQPSQPSEPSQPVLPAPPSQPSKPMPPQPVSKPVRHSAQQIDNKTLGISIGMSLVIILLIIMVYLILRK